MSLLSQIVAEEKDRIKKMISEYEQELGTLPKGTLVGKNVKDKQYFYLQFREGKKIVSSYIGGKADKIDELRERINRRKHIEAMLKALKIEYAQAIKITGGGRFGK